MEDEVNYAIGRALAAMREARGFSQPYVARALGRTQPNVSQLENGRRAVRPLELMQLAAIYETTPADIYAAAEPAMPDALTRKARQLQTDINARLNGEQKG